MSADGCMAIVDDLLGKNYHISCRVRNTERGVDSETVEHAGITMLAQTPIAALAGYLVADERSWLQCSADAFATFLKKSRTFLNNSGRSEMAIMGWDSHVDGGDSFKTGYPTDWESSWLVEDSVADTLELHGTAATGQFEFELSIKPEVSETILEPPVKVESLSMNNLRAIVGNLRGFLFLGSKGWELDREVSGADFVEHAAAVFNAHGLAPRIAGEA